MIAENNPTEEDATLILWSIRPAQVHFCQRRQLGTNKLPWKLSGVPQNRRSITKTLFPPANHATSGLIFEYLHDLIPSEQHQIS